MTTDDFDLLQAYARDRSQEAFARLVAKYSDMVFATSLRRTRRRELAEDVTQAVFIVLGRSAGRLRKHGSIAAWLHRTAIYASANALRAERRRIQRERAGAHHEAVEDSLDDAAETFAAIENAMQHLRSADRNVLSLHYLEGRSIEQAAQSLDISIEAARKRLSRALERLRGKLAGNGTLLSAGALSIQMAGLGTSNGHLPMTYALIAGGKAGRAFDLASQVIRAMRMMLLKQAAAAMVTIVAIAGVGKAVFSASAPPRTQLAVADEPVKLAPIAPATQPALATTSPSLVLPKAVEEALLANARDLSSITVGYRAQRISNVGSAKQLSDTIKQRIEMVDYILEPRDYLMTWQDGKYLCVAKLPEDNVGAFDGHALYMRSNGTHSKWLPQSETKRSEASFCNGSYYFDTSGFTLPTRVIDLIEHRQLQSKILWLLAQEGSALAGVDEAKVGERLLMRLRLVVPDPARAAAKRANLAHVEEELKKTLNSPEQNARELEYLKTVQAQPTPLLTFAFYLDPQLRYAVRQEQQYEADGKLLTLIVNDNFEQLAGKQVWLPRTQRQDDYSFGVLPRKLFDKAIMSTTVSASSFSSKRLEDGAFVPEPLAGMHVIDRTGEKEVSYRIPGPPPEETPLVGEIVSTSTSSSSNTWLLVIAANVVVLILLVVVVKLNRKRTP